MTAKVARRFGGDDFRLPPGKRRERRVLRLVSSSAEPRAPRKTGEASKTGSISETTASRQSASVGNRSKIGDGSFATKAPMAAVSKVENPTRTGLTNTTRSISGSLIPSAISRANGQSFTKPGSPRGTLQRDRRGCPTPQGAFAAKMAHPL